MYITTTLAQIMGLYLFLVGVAMILNPENFKLFIKDFQKNKSLIIYSSLISTILGLIIIRIHNVWIPGWPVLITLIGWVLLLKGLYRIFFLQRFVSTSKKMLTQESYKWFCWISIILGGYLSIMGFIG